MKISLFIPHSSKQFLSVCYLMPLLAAIAFCSCSRQTNNSVSGTLLSGFQHPPDSSRPGVYWYFMDGNMSRDKMTEDLESMKKVGIGHVLFLEVNVGVPRGKVDFLSDQWQELFKHAVREAERLGITITLGTGPGWTGSGGPWVKPEQSMQDLVSSSVNVSGAGLKNITLPKPAPRKPFFGEGGFTPGLKKQWDDFYEDVAVLAFPGTVTPGKIADIDEKALYYRAPYSSAKGVKQFLPTLAVYPELPQTSIIKKNTIIDLTSKLKPDGTIDWEVPLGNWTIMRFGSRNNGAVTRPAPFPGLGFESDKFDSVALDAHLQQFTGKLLNKIGGLNTKSTGGLKTLHMDSWEMGSQNWTPKFRQEFIKRRGYDPLPFYPVYAGDIIESTEVSERFLWDLRVTSQDLILEQHATHLKNYAHRNGFRLSIEPYDMNPTADLELGNIADIAMSEFWSKDFGYSTSFSVIEATSIAHVNGISLVPAEAFTAEKNEGWKQHPGSMKNQGDWAFASGINRFVYHTFQHQELDDSLKPGMTMGPYGIHWDRSQTWWPMAGAYHDYVSRCQYMLQQGRTVADILYLTPEGAPHVFRAPASALKGDAFIPDRKGYNFDGCSPAQLYKAAVINNQVVFPGGASYRLLVLPASVTMTPALLEKIRSLVNDGAIVAGEAPEKSPSLSGYPGCDSKIQSLATELWGNTRKPGAKIERVYGKGKIISGTDLKKDSSIYPSYDATAALLQELGVSEDFQADAYVRYTHRTSGDQEVYFIANGTDQTIKANCTFRADKAAPELWDPITGQTRSLPEFSVTGGKTTIPMQFDPYQSFFIVFPKNPTAPKAQGKNFPGNIMIAELNSPWTVSFDPKWGGPANIEFIHLDDWINRSENGIKYYSGIATYKQDFKLDAQQKTSGKQLFLDLGIVKNMARVKLNGKDLGVVWTAPWTVDITGTVKAGDNQLEIEVANLWANRLIGDEQLPDDGIKAGKWPDWFLQGMPRTSGRYTFTTYKHYKKDSPLLSSGLLGPVTIHQKVE